MKKIENFLIVDIGGRSTEFIYEFGNRMISESLNLGVVTLTEKYFSNLLKTFFKPPENILQTKMIFPK